MIGIALWIPRWLQTHNQAAHVDTGHEVSRTEDQRLQARAGRGNLVDIDQATCILNLGLNSNGSNRQSRLLLEDLKPRSNSKDVGGLLNFGQYEGIKAPRRTPDHRCEVFLVPLRRHRIYTNRQRFLAKATVDQCADGVTSGLVFGKRGH